MRSIDPVLLSKIRQQNQTIYNNADPKMSVQVSRAKTTVSDSTYWTVETIREKPGLGDLSLAARREKAYGPPNRIYNIYVDNGIVKTAIREYPDSLKEKWKYQFDLGAGSAVAIAFDGEWERWRKKWQLKTYENPWLFWVDETGKLFAQLWDDDSTREILDYDVVKTKAIRGWKNVYIPTDDQGIVVAYIKNDQKVYYRNYCGQSDGTFAWEPVRQLNEFTDIAINLNLFITNDYRVGFIIEDSHGKNSWYITSRNWAGTTVEIEHVTGQFGSINSLTLTHIEIDNIQHDTENEYTLGKFGSLQLISLSDEEALSEGSVDSAEIINQQRIKLVFNLPLAGNIDVIKNYLIISNESDTVSYEIASTELGDNQNELIIVVSSELDTENNVKIAYKDISAIFVKPGENSMSKVAEFEVVAAGLVEEPQHHIYLYGGFNQIQIIVTEITKESIGTLIRENITGKYGAITLISLTKINSDNI